jgi:hypothetical protein
LLPPRVIVIELRLMVVDPSVKPASVLASWQLS